MANDETEHGGHRVDAREEQQIADRVYLFQRELLSLHIDIEQHVDNVILRVIHVLCHHLKEITADLLPAGDALFHGGCPIKARLPGIKFIETLRLQSQLADKQPH